MLARRDALREALSTDCSIGAVVEFSGQVRNNGDLSQVIALDIDYYEPLTRPALKQLAQTAGRRWPLSSLCLLHRVGHVTLGEPIVWLGVASPHRADAFAAATFVMDRLKTDVPFWKKEISAQGQTGWVHQKHADCLASASHDA